MHGELLFVSIWTEKITFPQKSHVLEFEAKLEDVSHISIFKNLSEDEVRRLAPCLRRLVMKPMEVIVRQGEIAKSMFIIMDGSCIAVVDPTFSTEGVHQREARIGKEAVLQVWSRLLEAAIAWDSQRHQNVEINISLYPPLMRRLQSSEKATLSEMWQCWKATRGAQLAASRPAPSSSTGLKGIC